MTLLYKQNYLLFLLFFISILFTLFFHFHSHDLSQPLSSLILNLSHSSLTHLLISLTLNLSLSSLLLLISLSLSLSYSQSLSSLLLTLTPSLHHAHLPAVAAMRPHRGGLCATRSGGVWSGDGGDGGVKSVDECIDE